MPTGRNRTVSNNKGHSYHIRTCQDANMPSERREEEIKARVIEMSR